MVNRLSFVESRRTGYEISPLKKGSFRERSTPPVSKSHNLFHRNRRDSESRRHDLCPWCRKPFDTLKYFFPLGVLTTTWLIPNEIKEEIIFPKQKRWVL